MDSLRRALAFELADLETRNLDRRLRGLQSAPGPRVLLDGRPVLVFGSNNYLGLTEHPDVRRAAAAAALEWGTGAGGSRLLTGNLPLHQELETELATLKGAEAALLFPTGYQAATGTIPALAGSGDLILSDALNHASLIDGCRLSRAEVRIYRHGDVNHAQELLADRQRFRRCLIITDGVFSMDGDLAPLRDLTPLAADFDAWLMVDDAHGTGVLGQTGAGTAEHLGVQARVPVQMATLSKALGAQGGFIAGSHELISFLRNRARAFIYSTALAPASAAAALAALRVMRSEPERRRQLRENAARLRGGLQGLGLPVPEGETPVVPVVVGGDREALELSARLEAAGVWAPAIRPPTVPPGTARLRLAVMATHQPCDLDEALAAFAGALPAASARA
jgi:8-amino-7-oxononanoate synthase